MVVHRGALTLSAISPLPVSRIDFRTRQCLLSPATVPCRQPPARVPCPAHSESLCPFRCHKSRTRLRFSPCTAPSASRFPSQTRGVIPRASSRLRYPPPSNMLLHSRPPPSNMLPRSARTPAHVVMWWSVFLGPLDSVPDSPHVWSTTSAVRAALGRSGETPTLTRESGWPPVPPRTLTVVSPDDPSP